ncbi:hypothetical protein [Cypionkella sinensis]|uniref:Uncharacterized protein n=1 Tax=Cypionkella sinensis TaxID=1756043 RepID=A0ABV7J229_9RHOB
MSPDQVSRCHILKANIGYTGVMMDPMFEIPKDRKRLSVGKLCVLLALTVLLYMMIAHEFGLVTQALTAPTF